MFGNFIEPYYHLAEKGHLSEAAFELVDWDANESFSNKTSPGFLTWVTKHVSGQCGVGRRMLQWGFWDNDLCPCCQAPNETTRHLAVCPSYTLSTAFETNLQKLETWLRGSDTHPAEGLSSGQGWDPIEQGKKQGSGGCSQQSDLW